MRYRIVEENKLRRLIESDMIYGELCAWGVDNWIGFDEVKFPESEEIEEALNQYDKFEECDYDD